MLRHLHYSYLLQRWRALAYSQRGGAAFSRATSFVVSFVVAMNRVDVVALNTIFALRLSKTGRTVGRTDSRLDGWSGATFGKRLNIFKVCIMLFSDFTREVEVFRASSQIACLRILEPRRRLYDLNVGWQQPDCFDPILSWGGALCFFVF